MGFGREDMENQKGRYGKPKRKIWKTKKEDMENKKGNPFFERISFFLRGV